MRLLFKFKILALVCLIRLSWKHNYREIIRFFAKHTESHMKNIKSAASSTAVESIVFDIWEKIQSHELNKDIENMGKLYTRTDFINDLKTLFFFKV